MPAIPPSEAAAYGPCAPLVSSEDLDCGCALDQNIESNVVLLEKAFLWASRRVMLATGYRFTGICQTTIRPCREPCDPYALMRRRDGVAGPNGHLVDEWGTGDLTAIPLQQSDGPEPNFVNCWACTCSPNGFSYGTDAACRCGLGNALALPYLPVSEVVEVLIDGVAVDPSLYRLIPRSNLLVRVPDAPWPNTPNLSPDDSVAGSWSVTFRHGLNLPPEGKPLVARYACELAKKCRGMKCPDLSEGIRVASRSGVEYVVIDSDYRDKGLTGFVPLDDWIMQILGGHSRTRPHMAGRRPRRRPFVLEA